MTRVSTSILRPDHPGHEGRASHVLLADLVDDAAVFPPGDAPLPQALAEHAAHRAAWYADVVGPLLCKATEAGALTGLLSTYAGPSPLHVGIVSPGGAEDALAAARTLGARDDVRVDAAELPLAPAADADGVWAALQDAGALQVWWEVDRGADLGPQLDRLALSIERHGMVGGAKLRTGGASAAAFPSAEELGGFVRSCIDRDLTFKLTAGLHHALRHTAAATGYEHHGVLNVLVAVRAALNGAELAELVEVLEEREAAPLVGAAARMSDADASVVRAFFASYGCCGVTDPIGDLVDLGLLERPEGAR